MRQVALVTPTMGRQHLHPQLHQTFRDQTVTQTGAARLYVLDESPQPSPYFVNLKDSDVTYVHRIAAPRRDGLSRIGAARNALNMLTPPGCVIVHIDDDDVILPTYTSKMLDRLGDADICKMDVWRILHEKTGLVFEWDTRSVGKEHYALLGNEVVDKKAATSEITQEFMELLGVRDGFGWSLVYPRKTWEEHPFPPEDTEDLPFVQNVRAAGGKIVFVSDLGHLALHVVSEMSKIACYPQRMLGAAAADKESSLWSAVACGMIGAMGAMTELPAGQTIRLVPGVTYSLLAQVKTKHSLRAITNRAARMGVTIASARDNVLASEFGVASPPSDYRLIHAIGASSADATLPWSAPGFFAAFDKSTVVKAWSSAPAFVGAAKSWDAARMPLTGYAAAIFGAGHAVSEGTKAYGAAKDLVERYDPKRYAGKEPPHRCTVASATAIAQQLPGAPWVFAGELPAGSPLPWPTTERIAPVTTPMGRKNIPMQVASDGIHMSTQCPYTGAIWLFSQLSGAVVGAGRAIGSGALQPVKAPDGSKWVCEPQECTYDSFKGAYVCAPPVCRPA